MVVCTGTMGYVPPVIIAKDMALRYDALSLVELYVYVHLNARDIILRYDACIDRVRPIHSYNAKDIILWTYDMMRWD